MSKIAFVGLGNMGGPMAANLVKAGHQVCVFDLVPEAVATLEGLGASSARTAQEACTGASIVISMLPAGKHVAGLYLGPDGLVESLPQDCLVIDSSTIDAETARQVATACADKGIEMVDAPVSGGVAAAQAGTLTFMCGGKAEAYEHAVTVLKDMGKATFHAGPSGSGQIAKMCNNMLLAIHMIGTSEALSMGEKCGLDPSVLSEIMLASSGRNWSLELYNPCPGVMEKAPASNDYKPGFMVDLMVKDLGLAMENAQSTHSAVPLGEHAHKLFSEKQEHGDGKKDFSSIFELISGGK